MKNLSVSLADGCGNTRLNTTSLQNELSVHLDYLTLQGRTSKGLNDIYDVLNFITGFVKDCKYVLTTSDKFSHGHITNNYPHRIRGTHGLNGGYRYLGKENSCELTSSDQIALSQVESPSGSLASLIQPVKESPTNSSKVTFKGVKSAVEDCNQPCDIEWTLMLPGTFLEAIDIIAQWRMVVGLRHNWIVKCSRIDVAIDDPTYSLIPREEMRESYKQGDAFSFRKYKQIITYDKAEAAPLITDYYGSRNSGKMVRVYDHDSECLRFETEFKRNYASVLFNTIAEMKRGEVEGGISLFADSYEEVFGSPLNCIHAMKDCIHAVDDCIHAIDSPQSRDNFHGIFLQKMLGAYAVGAIDFRDKSRLGSNSHAHRGNTKRCKFYQDFVKKIGSHIKLAIEKRVTTFDAKLKWFQRQVAPTLALMQQGLGNISFKKLIETMAFQADERLNIVHRMYQEIFKSQKQQVLARFGIYQTSEIVV